MSLDQKRIESHRNSCCPFIKQEIPTNSAKQQSTSEKIFAAYGRLIMKKSNKMLVLLISMGLGTIGIWGNILLEQQFDPTWFLPPGSYLYNWTKLNREYFPYGGDKVILVH